MEGLVKIGVVTDGIKWKSEYLVSILPVQLRVRFPEVTPQMFPLTTLMEPVPIVVEFKFHRPRFGNPRLVLSLDQELLSLGLGMTKITTP